MPKVSVIIPNYNHEKFLDQRLRTIFNQTYQDFEVILLDDASTDNSDQVFSRYIADKRVKLFCNQVNSGSPFKQWNKGFRESQGEYLWIAESDDYAGENFLATLVNKLDNHPRVGLVYCQSWIVDDNNQVSGTLLDYYQSQADKERWRKDYLNDGKDECRNYLSTLNTIPNASAVLIRRSAFEQAGGADEILRLSGDWMLWLKISLTWDIAFVAQPLNFFRIHTNTVRKKSDSDGTFITEFYSIQDFISHQIMIPDESSKKAYTFISYRWFNLGLENKITFTQSRSLFNAAKKVDKYVTFRMLGYLIKYPPKVILGRQGLNFHFIIYMTWLIILNIIQGLPGNFKSHSDENSHS